MNDISVSRCHSVIKFNKDEQRFYIEDSASKFGTLKLAPEPLPITSDKPVPLQIGRTVISFAFKDYGYPKRTRQSGENSMHINETRQIMDRMINRKKDEVASFK